jgi:FkbM family methyltransferase
MSASYEITLSDGSRITVPGELRVLTTFVLLEQERWFEPDLDFVLRFLEPGMSVIDIGASYGTYALPMARRIGATGKLRAFEPTPDVAAFLEGNLATSGADAQVIRIALSDHGGEGRLARGKFDEVNRIVPVHAARSDALAVPMDTLDAQASAVGVPAPDFVKIDVEGHCGQVVRGADRLFREAAPLIMFEIRDGAGVVDRSSARSLIAAGYATYRLLPGPGVLVPFDAEGPADPFLLNLYAAKPATLAQLRARGLLVDPESGARAPSRSWRQWAAPLPYAQHALRYWKGSPGLFARAGRKALYAALDDFAASRAGSGPVTWGHINALLDARDHAIGAADADPTLGALLTLARIEHELGNRGFAVQALERAAGALGNTRPAVPDAPFLPPLARYDQVGWDGRDPDWLDAALHEALIRLEAFSSYYDYGNRGRTLERIARLPFASPEMERRRQLLRIRAALQTASEASAAVSSEGPENLNAKLWRQTGAIR